MTNLICCLLKFTVAQSPLGLCVFIGQQHTYYLMNLTVGLLNVARKRLA